MSDQIALREISSETFCLYHHREKEDEKNMWNLNINEHQGLGICFNRCKLASIIGLKDDQFIHIL